MKKINAKLFLRSFAAAALFCAVGLLNFSCSKDDGPDLPAPTVPDVVTYVLSEGASSATGVLAMIDGQGVYNDSVFARANPGRLLGTASQDLTFYGDNIYVISQNGGQNGVGMLLVADLGTMKLKAEYSKTELSPLSWPTHIAVVNTDKAYVRDGKGLSVVDLKNHKVVKLIDGTSGAIKARMVNKGSKVYVGAGSNLLAVNAVADKVDTSLPMDGAVHNVIEGPDGSVWVCAGSKLLKIDAAKDQIAGTYSLGVSPDGWPGVGLCVTPSGDTFFFSSGTNVYKYKLGDASAQVFFKTEEKITEGNIVYGQLAIHPVTGLLHVPTIKNYGTDYLVNSVALFRTDVAGDPVKVYSNRTRMVSGFYFHTK